MEKDWLASRLESGRSIESIAREAGKAASTVAYWVKKFGLHSLHAPQHAPRGGFSREELESLVVEGLSIRAMAARLDVSYATVRHWLLKFELLTPRARRLKETAAARAAGTGIALATCERHGLTEFGRRSEGGYRCQRCRAASVVARRRRVKEILVAEAGGCCVLCGYDRHPRALQFHHLEPGSKAFGLAFAGAARSLARCRAEVAKCVLLCSNCHAEVESGIATIPIAAQSISRG